MYQVGLGLFIGLLLSNPGLSLAQLPAVVPVSAGSEVRHYLQVIKDPIIENEILAGGGRLVADYGSFQVFIVAQISAALASNPMVEVRDDNGIIFLNSGKLDTASLRSGGLFAITGSFEGKRLHLIQFAGPLQPEWRAELLAVGGRIIAYIPENAYLIQADAVGVDSLRTWSSRANYVQWAGDYLAQYKIHPLAKTVDGNGVARSVGTDEFFVQLATDPEANEVTLQLLDQLSLAPRRTPSYFLEYLNLVVRLTPETLPLIADRPDLVSIVPRFPRRKLDERQDQIIAGNLVGTQPNGPGYLAWLAGKGFTQAQFVSSGFLVDLTDSGVDTGTTIPNHFGLYSQGSYPLGSRLSYARLSGSPNSGSTLAGCDGHGTLNAHIIGGYDNVAAGFPHTDQAGYHYGLGVCPFVGLGSSVIFDPDSYTDPVFPDLQSRAYHSGARISNNSWGSPGSAGIYDADAQTFDALVRDAQPAGSAFGTTGNQEMVLVVSAGNDGPGTGSINSPGSAKNVITVGAAEGVRAIGGTDGSGVSDTQADSANDIIGFSSRGPCADGRHKPEIVAPGTHITGGVYQASTNLVQYPNGIAATCYDGSGVSGGPGGVAYFPASQQYFTASSGTSHSAPAVSGGVALLRQYFLNQGSNAPSPAMTKAYLMNSARYVNGLNAAGTLWSDTQGMGEMNLGLAFDGTARWVRDELPEDMFTASGQVRNFVGTIVDPAQPFRVTLVWTDAPGNTTGAAYNNNLDLVVNVAGNTYKGNVFNGQYSVTGGAADARNNAESVFLPAGLSGAYSVQVVARNINSDGVPNNSTPLDQDFALVVYNSAGGISVITNGASLALETCFPTNGVVDPGEFVTVNLALKNTGVLSTSNVVATLQTSGGVLSPSPAQAYGSLVAGGAAVTNSFNFVASGSCGGTVLATLQLQDGALDLGTVVFPFRLGKYSVQTLFTENFDVATPPTLPAAWTSVVTGAGQGWVTRTSASDSAPQSVFAADIASVGVSELISPPVFISTANAQLSFRNYYNLENSSSSPSVAYDGGVLEIRLGSGAFVDILTAGASFSAGGYNATISSSFGNPLAGRRAWSGNAGGFITTTVSLPAAAFGQSVQFKWRCGSDSSTATPGWSIDTISLNDGGSYLCCNSVADLAVAQSVLPATASLGQAQMILTTVSNAGPSYAVGATLSGNLSPGIALDSIPIGFSTNATGFSGMLGSLAPGISSNLLFTFHATIAGVLSNSLSITSTTVDPAMSNNSAAGVVRVLGSPLIQKTILDSTSFGLQIESVPGLNYVLEATDSLDPSHWVAVSALVIGTGGMVTVTDSTGLSSSRFYRVRCF